MHVDVAPALHGRDRLTTALRPVLAVPHVLLVGGPLGAVMSWTWYTQGGDPLMLGAGGALGGAAAAIVIVAWFAILFTGTYPRGLRNLLVLYLRWRVRAVAYMALLRDEFPPLGEGRYPASLAFAEPDAPRHRLSVAFRFVLALPHLVVLAALGIAWACSTVAAWVAILLTGRMPRALHHFGTGMLRWSTRVEAYLLLLHDEWPPFSFE